MSKFSGLEKLTPVIIKFPFQQLLKSIINLRVGRKIPSSIAKILAFVSGLGVGYFIPEIGNFMAFFLNLFVAAPLSSAVVATLTVACSMILTASAFVFLTKKTFQMYYKEKYGVSNSELRLTERDKKILFLRYSDEEPKLTKKEINNKIKEIDSRIKFLVNKIRIYKITEQITERKTAKYALNCLKRGDRAVFNEIYERKFQNRFKDGTDSVDTGGYGRTNYDYNKYGNNDRYSKEDYWAKSENDSENEPDFAMRGLFSESDDEYDDNEYDTNHRSIGKYRTAVKNDSKKPDTDDCSCKSSTHHKPVVNLHVNLYKRQDREQMRQSREPREARTSRVEAKTITVK